jgi:hypothetical protein
MMPTAEQITVDDVRRIILEVSITDFLDKTIDEVEVIMNETIGYTVEEAVLTQMAPELIRKEVHLAFLCYSEEHPEEDEYENDDPKNDMGFWRTGIQVSSF